MLTGTFLRAEDGAVTVDWTVLTAGLVGMGLATATVVSGGVEDLSRDIRAALEGVEISAEFRDLVGQVCAAAGLGTGPGPGGFTGETFAGNPVTALLIYQSSDFVGGLPAEQGWNAGGPSPHALTLSPNAQPILLYLSDDDGYLHENDDSQLVAQDVVIDGSPFEAGDEISSGYTLIDSGSGMALSGLHFGDQWTGQMQGPVFATAATNPLEPGETYTFDVNLTTHNNETAYAAFLGCA